MCGNSITLIVIFEDITFINLVALCFKINTVFISKELYFCESAYRL